MIPDVPSSPTIRRDSQARSASANRQMGSRNFESMGGQPSTLILAVPVVTKAPFLPLEHGSPPDETKPIAPIGPQACEPRPEHPVTRVDPQSARSASLVDDELMTRRNNLQLKREPPAERGDEEMHQCNAESSHGSVEWACLGARSQAILSCASAMGQSRRSGGKVNPNQCARISGTHRSI